MFHEGTSVDIAKKSYDHIEAQEKKGKTEPDIPFLTQSNYTQEQKPDYQKSGSFRKTSEKSDYFYNQGTRDDLLLQSVNTKEIEELQNGMIENALIVKLKLPKKKENNDGQLVSNLRPIQQEETTKSKKRGPSHLKISKHNNMKINSVEAPPSVSQGAILSTNDSKALSVDHPPVRVKKKSTMPIIYKYNSVFSEIEIHWLERIRKKYKYNQIFTISQFRRIVSAKHRDQLSDTIKLCKKCVALKLLRSLDTSFTTFRRLQFKIMDSSSN